jgi:hypothetical protein
MTKSHCGVTTVVAGAANGQNLAALVSGEDFSAIPGEGCSGILHQQYGFDSELHLQETVEIDCFRSCPVVLCHW